MRKEEYQILKKFVPIVKLVSLTKRLWYDSNDKEIPWVDGDVIFPNINDFVYNINITDELLKGYYQWNGTTWLVSTIVETYENFNIPIFLDETIYDLGVMSEFDGRLEQIEQKCNFTYTGTTNTITLYNSVNTNDLGVMCGVHFTIHWGDNTSSTLPMLQPSTDVNLPFVTHTYAGGTYTIVVTVNSPWLLKNVSKTIKIPFPTPTYPTDLGELTFVVPYVIPPITGVTQEYLEDYTTLTGNTNVAKIIFLGIGKSRLDEFRKYGESDAYLTGLTITPTYTGYTIDQLQYIDFDDGFTSISGYTTGTTEGFYHEETYNGMLTRNEHFIGFIEEPVIYSNIFVERGKLGVMERNLRLGEIESTGELEIYGNGFFNIRKQ